MSPAEFWPNQTILRENISHLIGKNKLYQLSILEFDEVTGFDIPDNLEGIVLGVNNFEKITYIGIAYCIKTMSKPKLCFSRCLSLKLQKNSYSYTFSSTSTASFLSSSNAMEEYIQSKTEQYILSQKTIPSIIQHRDMLMGGSTRTNRHSCLGCFSPYKPHKHYVW